MHQSAASSDEQTCISQCSFRCQGFSSKLPTTLNRGVRRKLQDAILQHREPTPATQPHSSLQLPRACLYASSVAGWLLCNGYERAGCNSNSKPPLLNSSSISISSIMCLCPHHNSHTAISNSNNHSTKRTSCHSTEIRRRSTNSVAPAQAQWHPTR